MYTKFIIFTLLGISMFSNSLFGQKSYKTLVYEGNEKFKASNYDAASSRYLEAIKSKGKDFTAHYNLGNALYKGKKYEEAKTEFEKAQKLSETIPDKAAALHNLGNTYMQMNQPEKAADFYKQALKHDPYSEATRKNFEIAKLKEKQNQQQKNKQDNNPGKGGDGKDQQDNKDQNGDPKDQNKDQGNGQKQEGESQNGKPDPNKQNDGRMPKELENAILNKIADKEKETAKRILNKDSYSMPQSNEKDW
ncbi:tetratricopeptide repeat protein [Chryseobacterium sp.]|uniref:tetratricopeptide repeat protein n=1 Tax=Chryseobacterium sp. TaxID=1871047 RepID=UPI00388EAE19